MGGCASKNKKQPKEEPYKPADAPKDKAEVEEVIGEETQAVANKSPVRQNGSASEFRNSLVGPGGVILPNQPAGKDEADPSIPFIDAAEDEMEKQAKNLAAKASKAEESVKAEVVTGVEAVKAEVNAGAESAVESAKAGIQEVGDKAETAAKSVSETVSQTATETVDKLKTSVSEEASKGESLVAEVFKDVKSEGTVKTEEIKVTIGEKVDDATASVKDIAESGEATAKSAVEKVEEAAKPVVEGIQNFSLSDAIDKVVPEDDSEFTGFTLLETDDKDVVGKDEDITNLCESVGFIYSPYFTGTGFRVGDKYIMTSHCVIKSITEKIPTLLGATPEKQLIGSKEIWIQFDYLQMGEYELDNPTRFKFASISYVNPGLDVAIIELEQQNDKTLPPPLTSFSDIGTSKVEFLGHNGAPKRRRKLASQISQPTEEELKKVSSWCISRGFPADSFSGLEETNRVRFQQVFAHDSCGSPGVMMKGEELSVAVMLIKNYPPFFSVLEEDQVKKIPVNFQVDEGICLISVYNELKDQAQHSELCNNIFGQGKCRDES